MSDHEADPETVEKAMDEFAVISNRKVVAKAMDELNRVDLSKMDDRDVRAYASTLESITWLRESLGEAEKRRPNAQVHAPYEVTDD